MKFNKDIDYIKFYADKMKEDKKFFKQQKMMIDSQIKASQMIFRKRFGSGEEFKENARNYLKELGIIKSNS